MLSAAVVAWSLAAGTLACGAHAADKPIYAPPGDWVKPIPIPDKPPSADGAASQTLLQNVQDRFGPKGDESFQEVIVKILAPQGLSDTGVILPWRPDTETLVIHRLNIIRDGKTIDQLNGGKTVTILRRETNLEMAMLDGALTATVQPVGLQVGDVIDVAYTYVSRDPVMQGHSIGYARGLRPGVIARLYISATWPNSKPIRWRAREGFPDPVVSQTGDQTRLVIDQANFEAPKPPNFAPPRFSNLATIEFSQFADWREFSAMMAPLYVKASALSPNSPLKAEIAAIAAASADPKTRAAAALRLVEDKVRYLLLAMNNGGYIPANADETWTRRFGDCKAKTVLLLALLHGLGVEAEPVLVNSAGGDGMDEHLPIALFDHVLVRAVIQGRTYWLDGTRLGDSNLDRLPTPTYRWVLPVSAQGADLERLPLPVYTEPHFESVMNLDARGGLDTPAAVHAEHIFRGDEGLAMHLVLSQGARADVEKVLRDYWRGKISWVEPKSVNFSYDETTQTTTLTLDGSGVMDWAASGAARDFDVRDSSLGYQVNFEREPGPGQDAPYAVVYPAYRKSTVSVQLPNKGSGFALLNAYEDERVAGSYYTRRSKLDGLGVATVVTTEQALDPEFPAGEAKSAAAALNRMAQYDGTIRFGASPAQASYSACFESDPARAIQGCGAILADKAAAPAVRLGAYMTRAAAYGLEGQLDLAIADEGQAIALQPSNPGPYLARAELYERLKRYDLAAADAQKLVALQPSDAKAHYALGNAYREQRKFDMAVAEFAEAIRLDPSNINAYLARGLAHIANDQADLAVADGDLAVKIQPDAMKAYSFRAHFYEAAHRWDQAIADRDKILSMIPRNSGVLNAACWIRAEANRDLDTALSDCNAGIVLAPNSADIVDSRAFVLFREGKLADAEADYNAALALNPKLSSSLFMRGVIKHRLGDVAGGDADIAAAKAIDPKISETYAQLGVTP